MRLSIVTICRNDRDGLARTLASTFDGQRDFSDWEQIIIDGASSDGSWDIASRWQNNPRMGFSVSEPDSGIYNAMNKGIAHAKGDYLLFLNAGDSLLPSILAKVFSGSFNADILYGDMIISGKHGKSRLIQYPGESVVTPAYFLFGSLPHQASFIARDLFLRFGGYCEGLKIGSDSKFFLDCAMSGTVQFKHLDYPVSTFAQGGISTDPAKLEFGLEERMVWLTPVFGDYAARKATFPSPPWWAGKSVAQMSIRDHAFGQLLWASNRVSLACWKVPPIRFLLRAVLGISSWFLRLFRS